MRRTRQSIVRDHFGARVDWPAADELGIQVLAEGVETESEFKTLAAMGVRLFQGYYLGDPMSGQSKARRGRSPRKF